MFKFRLPKFKVLCIETQKYNGIDWPTKGTHVQLIPYPFPKDAITLYPFVFHRSDDPSGDLVVHEEVHIRQVLDRIEAKGSVLKGWISWYASYIVEWVKNGYRMNRYEAAARKKSSGK